MPLDCIPDKFVINRVVAVDNTVAHGYNPAQFRDPIGETGLYGSRAVEGFPEYFELPLHGRPKQ